MHEHEDPFTRRADRSRVRAEFIPRTPRRRRLVKTSLLRPRFAPVLVVVVSLATAVVAGPVAAQSDPGATVKGGQEQQRRSTADVNAELNVLQASDDQLNTELMQLDDRLKQQENAALAAAEGSEAARGRAEELSGQVAEASRAAEVARREAAARAVEAYMRPGRESATQVLAARDPNELAKMQLLVSHVAEYDRSKVFNRQTSEYLLKLRQGELVAAQREAERLSQEASAGTTAIAQLKVQRAGVHDELEQRISGLKEEAEALAQQETQLAALIAQRQSATTTTSSAPPPTSSATTGSVPPSTPPLPGAATTTLPSTPNTVTPVPTTGKPPPTPSGRLSWPISGTVTSGFGPRWGTFHNGIDVGAAEGVPIGAAADGVVFFAGVMDGYGNVTLIDHGNGTVTLYAHQSKLVAAQGARVSRGATVGLVGSTGRSTGPHLHFEVRVAGTAHDPLGYLG
jgi:murein DD-endopeptidase MepM/ murein hydrolase activator NlpD